MSPFTGQLNRVGYLVWNVCVVGGGVATALLINSVTDPRLADTYLAPLRVVLMIVFTALALLLTVRRLQNVGLSGWLAIPIAVVPFLGMLFWLALFFIPSKTKPAID